MEADCESIERKKISVSAGTRELATALLPPSFPLIILEPSLDPTMPARVAQPVPFQNSPRTGHSAKTVGSIVNGGEETWRNIVSRRNISIPRLATWSLDRIGVQKDREDPSKRGAQRFE